MQSAITINGIDQAISNLNYRNKTALKYRLVSVIRGFYENEDSVETLREIDTNELIKVLWDTGDDPAIVRSRRRNLSSIKSSVNADLGGLYNNGKNPEGIIIGPSNIFVMSDEAKDRILDSFKNREEGGVSIDKVTDILKIINEILSDPGSIKDPGSSDGSNEFKLEKLKEIVNGLAEKVGAGQAQDVSISAIEGGEKIETDDYGTEDPDEDEELESEEIDEELEGMDVVEELEEGTDDYKTEELDEDEEPESEEIDEELEAADIVEELEEGADDYEVEEPDEDEELESEETDEELEAVDVVEELEEGADDYEAEEPDEDEEPESEEIDEELEAVDVVEELEEGADDYEAEEPDEDNEPESEETDEDFEVVDVIEGDEDADLAALGTEDGYNDDYGEGDKIERSRLLAEEFNNSLASSDKFYNQYLLIPEGKYIVGSKRPKGEERPEQVILLKPIYMGKYPIINALFEVFIEKTGYMTTAEKVGYGTVYYGRFRKEIDEKTGLEKFLWNSALVGKIVEGACWYQPFGPGSTLHNKRHHPVVQVSLEDAMAFAAWTGKRLPTEDEWEAASRTAGGYLYPWGNEKKDNDACNTEESDIGDTTPVDKYAEFKNSFGIIDTLGNVMEWTLSVPETPSPREESSRYYFVKGGSWISGSGLSLTGRIKMDPESHSNILGFRCVAY